MSEGKASWVGPSLGAACLQGDTRNFSSEVLKNHRNQNYEPSPEAVLEYPDRNRIQKSEDDPAASSVPFMSVVRVSQGASLRQMDTTCWFFPFHKGFSRDPLKRTPFSIPCWALLPAVLLAVQWSRLLCRQSLPWMHLQSAFPSFQLKRLEKTEHAWRHLCLPSLQKA